MHQNNCPFHELEPLISSGPCSASCFMVYIRPGDLGDNRRWLGFLSKSVDASAQHTHPQPVPSKLGSKLKGDIQSAVQKDPTKTADDISKGHGLGYNPISDSPAAANRSTLTHFVGKFKVDINGIPLRGSKL